MQTKIGSFLEACANIAVGYTINVTGNFIVLPLLGYDVTLRDNLVIGVFFTFVSLGRQYIIRRWFNKRG